MIISQDNSKPVKGSLHERRGISRSNIERQNTYGLVSQAITIHTLSKYHENITYFRWSAFFISSPE